MLNILLISSVNFNNDKAATFRPAQFAHRPRPGHLGGWRIPLPPQNSKSLMDDPVKQEPIRMKGEVHRGRKCLSVRLTRGPCVGIMVERSFPAWGAQCVSHLNAWIHPDRGIRRPLSSSSPPRDTPRPAPPRHATRCGRPNPV